MISNENYDLIAEEHINDPSIYKKIDENPMSDVLSSIQEKLFESLDKKDISNRLFKSLIEKDPKLGTFKPLPKLHKKNLALDL